MDYCYKGKEFIDANKYGTWQEKIFANKPKTNADRIRSMTDEELAEMLNHVQRDGFLVGIGRRKMSAYGNWLEWLKQEND